MYLREFYDTVIPTEEAAANYLICQGLLGAPDTANPCHKCGTAMRQTRKRDKGGEFRAVLRCPKKGCQTSRSLRRGNPFFHHKARGGNVHARLPLSAILELVFMFILDMSMDQVVALTGRSRTVVVDRFKMCRQVCSSIVSSRGKMVGTETEPILVDESGFAGRRGNGRGKQLARDQPSSNADDDTSVENSQSYGRQMDDLWVFGLKKGNDCRYFWVINRDTETLIPIIQRECEPGSFIHCNEWPAYGVLSSLGFQHRTVNHHQLHVDPATGVHTQPVERSWLDASTNILKKKRGYNLSTFQSHLDNICWRIWRKDEPDMFIAFLNDIKTVYFN